MRARIRALIAIAAVLGQLMPAPAAAQAPPPETAVTASPQFTTPQGGTLSLSLDEAVARALENNADIAVERYNPEISAEDVRGAEGYYDPFLFATLTKSSTDTKGTNLFSGGATVNTKTDVWNFGVQQAFQTGANLQHRLQQQPARHQQRLLDLQPQLQLELVLRPPAAPAEELRHRQPASAAQARQEEPRDHRRAVPPDGDQHGGDGQGLLLRAALRDRQPGGRSGRTCSSPRSCSTRTRSG